MEEQPKEIFIQLMSLPQVEVKEIEDRLTEMEDFAQFSYIFDKSLSEYDILARYINEDKGYVFVLLL